VPSVQSKEKEEDVDCFLSETEREEILGAQPTKRRSERAKRHHVVWDYSMLNTPTALHLTKEEKRRMGELQKMDIDFDLDRDDNTLTKSCARLRWQEQCWNSMASHAHKSEEGGHINEAAKMADWLAENTTCPACGTDENNTLSIVSPVISSLLRDFNEGLKTGTPCKEWNSTSGCEHVKPIHLYDNGQRTCLHICSACQYQGHVQNLTHNKVNCPFIETWRAHHANKVALREMNEKKSERAIKQRWERSRARARGKSAKLRKTETVTSWSPARTRNQALLEDSTNKEEDMSSK
jgi:hypothetical protein